MEICWLGKKGEVLASLRTCHQQLNWTRFFVKKTAECPRLTNTMESGGGVALSGQSNRNKLQAITDIVLVDGSQEKTLRFPADLSCAEGEGGGKKGLPLRRGKDSLTNPWSVYRTMGSHLIEGKGSIWKTREGSLFAGVGEKYWLNHKLDLCYTGSLSSRIKDPIFTQVCQHS